MLAWVVLIHSVSIQARSDGPPEVGDRAPDFVAVQLDGQELDSATLLGRPTLLDFWGVWCPPCIEAFPDLRRLHDDFSPEGLQVVGLAVLSGTAEEVSAFLEEHDVQHPNVLIEIDVARAFGVVQYPAYVLLDHDGRVAARYRHRPDGLYEAVAKDLEPLLHADSPPTPGPRACLTPRGPQG